MISTENKRDVVPAGKDPQPGQTPNWCSPKDLEARLGERFPGCMKGEFLQTCQVYTFPCKIV